MTEEIKIDGNSIQIGNKVCYCVDKDLLDYITNLQQKYEISQKDIQSLKNNYNDLVKISENKITNLQQENERLNNIINELHKALNKEINNLQNAKVESKEYVKCRTLCDILNKLSDLIGELKESGNNE